MKASSSSDTKPFDDIVLDESVSRKHHSSGQSFSRKATAQWLDDILCFLFSQCNKSFESFVEIEPYALMADMSSAHHSHRYLKMEEVYFLRNVSGGHARNLAVLKTGESKKYVNVLTKAFEQHESALPFII